MVLLRIDPPVDARYLHTTYLLDLAAAAGVRVVNHPAGIRALHEKLLALQLPDAVPADPGRAAEPAEVEAFVAAYGTAVVKPVDGFAGIDVWLFSADRPAGRWWSRPPRRAPARDRAGVPAAVADGNKRLFLLDGEIVGAVLRRPSADDFRIGPPVAAAAIDDADRRIAAALAPLLVAHGLAIAGLDVIDGRLIEVNVTCPGGMHKTDALLGTDLSGAIVRRLLDTALLQPKELFVMTTIPIVCIALMGILLFLLGANVTRHRAIRGGTATRRRPTRPTGCSSPSGRTATPPSTSRPWSS